jgi:hypothetical protein
VSRSKMFVTVGTAVVLAGLMAGCHSSGTHAAAVASSPAASVQPDLETTNPSGSAATTPGATSSTTSGASAPPSSVPASAQSPSPASKPQSSGSTNPVDVCAIFSIQAASKISGLDLSSSAADPGGAGQYGCSYSSNGTSVADLESQLDITVYTSASPLTLDTLKASLDAAASKDAPTVAISGIGDKAYASAVGTIAQAGDHVVEVAGLASDLRGDHAASSATASAVIAALG